MEHPTDAMRRTIAEQHDEIAALRADNAKLVMKLNAEHLVRQNVERENAKLRELVRDYERCTMHADCSRCEYDGKLSTHCPLSPCFPDTDELRELDAIADELEDEHE